MRVFDIFFKAIWHVLALITMIYLIVDLSTNHTISGPEFFTRIALILLLPKVAWLDTFHFKSDIAKEGK